VNEHAFLHRYGPWALVTGASDGIGRAFATRLAAIGFKLVIVARRGDRLQQLADEVTDLHGTVVRVVVADLGTSDGLAAVDGATADLDVGLLVAAAGYGTSGPLLQADIDREHNMLDVNCFATLHQCTVFGQRFTARGRGGMILMSSLLAWQGVPRSANYAATKAYVQSLAEGLRLELGPNGVDVLASAPGPVASGFAARADMRMGAALLPDVVASSSLAALGRRGTVIPGALSKLLTYSLLPFSRAIRTRILARVMGGMTRHQIAGAT
jgi:short-subunit dehydrogenase